MSAHASQHPTSAWIHLLLWVLSAAAIGWGLLTWHRGPDTPAKLPIAVGEQAGIYVAPRPLQLTDILEQPAPAALFSPFHNTADPVTGNELVHVWLRLPLANPHDAAQDYIIEVNRHWVGLARLYAPDDEGRYIIYQNSPNPDPRVRQTSYPVPAFKVSLPPHGKMTCFLLLQDNRWVSPAITIWPSAADFYAKLQRDDRFIHLYAGLLTGLFLAYLCVYLAFRYRDLLYYLLYLLSACVVNAVNFNLYANYVQPDRPNAMPAAGPDPGFFLLHGALLLSAALLLLFVREFLGLKTWAGRMARALDRAILVLLAVSPLVMIGPGTLLDDAVRVPTALIWAGANVLALALGIHAAFRRITASRYLIPAMVLLVIVSVRYATLAWQGGLVHDDLLQSWLYGSCVEMGILAFGLVDRFLRINRERHEAQEQAIAALNARAALQEEFTERLTRTVDERTSELQAANRQKERFLAFLAHDIRTPLNALVSVSTLIGRAPANFTPKQLQHYATEIEGNARGVSALMENLLDWARLQNNQVRLVPQEYLVDDLFEAALRDIATQASLKQQRLECEAPRHTYCRCDFTAIVAVLRNLAGNASKFTPEGGCIRLMAAPEGRRVRFTVTDQGIGLSPDDVARINHGETVASRHGLNGEYGTGLGLQICRELLQHHDASLTVACASGTGTSFTFTLEGCEFNGQPHAP